eukprot:scaffold6314_cov100-Isochrysis_galbana.AAC.4
MVKSEAEIGVEAPRRGLKLFRCPSELLRMRGALGCTMSARMRSPLASNVGRSNVGPSVRCDGSAVRLRPIQAKANKRVALSSWRQGFTAAAHVPRRLRGSTSSLVLVVGAYGCLAGPGCERPTLGSNGAGWGPEGGGRSVRQPATSCDWAWKKSSFFNSTCWMLDVAFKKTAGFEVYKAKQLAKAQEQRCYGYGLQAQSIYNM